MSSVLAAIGETMAQLVPDSGTVEDAPSFSVHVAGAESNVAIGYARLGGEAEWVSRLGDDALGRRVAAAISAEGVGVSGVVRDTARPTGLFVKDVTGEARPVVYYRAGSAASRISVSDVDDAVSRRPSALHTTGVTAALSEESLAAVRAIPQRVHDAGGLFSFDVNLRAVLWPDQETASRTLHVIAGEADVLFTGRDEAQALWGASTAEEIRRLFPCVPLLVVKDADVEATAFRGRDKAVVSAPEVAVVDPVGAGDAFAAGFLRAHLRGDPLRRALWLGHALAGVALRSRDDHGNPSAAADVWRRYGEGKEECTPLNRMPSSRRASRADA